MIKNSFIIFMLAISLISCEKITIDHHLKKEEIEKIFSEQSEVGRYQIVLGTLAVKQTYMIDTKTGRIWSFVVVPHREGSPTMWSEDYVENNENSSYSYKDFNEFFPYKKSQKSSEQK